MPRRAPRPCTSPGCPDPATTGGRCARHLIPRPRPAAAPRPSSAALGYDRAWRELSQRIRRQRPTCQRCGRRPSAHVDHVDGDRANRAEDNLRALCRPCHSTKTAQADGGFGNPRRPRGARSRR